MDGAPQPWVAALEHPYTRLNTALPTKTTPGMSSFGLDGDAWRWSSTTPPTNATPAKTRLTYSVHRQERYSVSAPPSNRPTAPPAMAMAP